MNNKMAGLTAALFLDGGWSLTGVVESSDENKMVIKSDGQLYLIFKNKVSAMSILDSKEAHASLRGAQPLPVEGRKQGPSRERTTEKSPFPENGLHYEDSSMSIPKSMLNISASDDNDLSAFFGPSGSGASSGMSFSIEGEDDIAE